MKSSFPSLLVQEVWYLYEHFITKLSWNRHKKIKPLDCNSIYTAWHVSLCYIQSTYSMLFCIPMEYFYTDILHSLSHLKQILIEIISFCPILVNCIRGFFPFVSKCCLYLDWTERRQKRAKSMHYQNRAWIRPKTWRPSDTGDRTGSEGSFYYPVGLSVLMRHNFMPYSNN